MKDIKIDKPLMRIQYWISWGGFIIFGFLIVWLIAIGLASYGKITSYDVKSKKGFLNKTWQKFVFIYGSIAGDLIILGIILSLLLGL